MKAKLIYKLPEDKYDFDCAVNGHTYRNILYDLDNWLRSEIKHNNKEAYQPVRDYLYELLEGIDLYE